VKKTVVASKVKPAAKATPPSVKKPVAAKSPATSAPQKAKALTKSAAPKAKVTAKAPSKTAPKSTPSSAKAVAGKSTSAKAAGKASPKVVKPKVAAKAAPKPKTSAASKTKSTPAAAKTPTASQTKPKAKPAPIKAVKVKSSKAVKSASTDAAKPASKTTAPPAPSISVPKVASVSTATPSAPPKLSKKMAKYASVPIATPSVAASNAAKAGYNLHLAPEQAKVILAPVHGPKKDPKRAKNWQTKALDQLEDADIIAMPDDEYMNAVQLAFFRRRLVQLRQDILSSADATTEHLREDTVIVPDPTDRATIEEEHALELRTRDRERKLMKKIEQSITRIDADDYGYCDETGEPIGVGRLLARPTATLSLEAQQRRELKQKMFGD
jgi:DnaK suppressor protein